MEAREKTVLVVGGGIAGVTAALDLAEMGCQVTLIEQDDFIGGHAARLTCKALESCQKCNACLVEPRLEEVLHHPAVSIMRRSRVSAITRQGRDLVVELQRRPAYIDPQRCTACGRCLEVCPQVEAGALRRPLVPWDLPRLALDPGVCLHFKDGKSALCVDACPEEALDLEREGERFQLPARAVVLASGFAPYPAGEKERLGYGVVPNVITALELETMLRQEGGVRRPSDGVVPRRVGFIQCVGSRDRQGHNYCSRVCCAYALRLGRNLRRRLQAEVCVFYMDLQSFGHVPDRFLRAARQELELIRSMPYDVLPGPEGTVRVPYQAQSGRAPRNKDLDLLVLSVGITPPEDNAELAQGFGLSRDQHGFLCPDPGQGIFVAGTAARPMDVAEVVAHAGRAAQETAAYLEEMKP